MKNKHMHKLPNTKLQSTRKITCRQGSKYTNTHKHTYTYTYTTEIHNYGIHKYKVLNKNLFFDVNPVWPRWCHSSGTAPASASPPPVTLCAAAAAAAHHSGVLDPPLACKAHWKLHHQCTQALIIKYNPTSLPAEYSAESVQYSCYFINTALDCISDTVYHLSARCIINPNGQHAHNSFILYSSVLLCQPSAGGAAYMRLANLHIYCQVKVYDTICH